MSKPGVDPTSGISSGDVLILPERHPACRRRETQLGFRMERENLAGDGKGTRRFRDVLSLGFTQPRSARGDGTSHQPFARRSDSGCLLPSKGKRATSVAEDF